MYFAYGWPKVAFTELQPGDAFIYLHATDKYFFAVSQTTVQLWTGGVHRLKLSECVRSEEDVKQEGWNCSALWSPAKATLAILTSENYLHLYAIHTWKDTLLPACNFAAKDIQKVDIYLRSSIRMDSESQALSLTGDSRSLLVGFADGTVASLSWLGKMREVAYPLDEATENEEASAAGDGSDDRPAARRPYGMAPSGSYGNMLQTPSHVSSAPATPPPEPVALQQRIPPPHPAANGGLLTPEDQEPSSPLTTDSAAAAAAQLASSVHSSPSAFASAALGFPGAIGSGHVGDPSFRQPARAIVNMSYCDRSKQVLMVLADGSCAVCGTSEGGLSPLSELGFGRWLCAPSRRAMCAQVGPRVQLIAVGCENGDVELYRLHPTAVGAPGSSPALGQGPLEPPVRTLSLESWGHKACQTGPVVQLEWSPDCRALAVGYGGQGVVVWSPSGCRLMCSLRQPGPSLSTAPSSASRLGSLISHQPSLRAMLNRQSLDPAGSVGSMMLSPAASGLPAAVAARLGGTAGAGSSGPVAPLDGSVTALCWGPMGYQLAVAEVGGGGAGGSLAEVLFAHSLPHHHRVVYSGAGVATGAGDEIHVLQAHDRLLMIREAGETALGGAPWASGDASEPAVGQVGDLTVAHVPLPHGYIAANWPVLRAAVSASGSDIAVAGRHGLAVMHRATERWRLFGDVSQERQVSCRALGWLSPGVLVACSGPDPHGPAGAGGGGGSGPGAGGMGGGAGGSNELLLFPRYHLDLTSLLARYSLDQPPIAMDCLGSHILLASEPLEITLLEVAVFGELSPTASPHATVSAVRKISMYDVGRQLSDVALVPLLPTEAAGRASASPRQCVLLRWGGLLSVLDLEQGCEVPLAQEVEAFWLSDALTCQAGGLAGSGELGLGLGLVPGGQGGAEGAAGGEAGDAGAQRGGAQGLDLGGLESGAEGSLVLGGAAGRGARGTVDSPLTPSALRQQQQQQPSGVGVESSGSGAGRRGTTEGIAAAAATLDVEMPWWLYGPAGMQLCFPSSLGSMAAQSYMSSKDGNDIELEFDQEVYPVGISLADDAIIGVTQRIVRGMPGMGGGGAGGAASAWQLPCFHPIPESQPVLPCLLRRLLQRGAFPEAVSLARRHARGPHFARSLEWLLFTALELETNTSSLTRGHGGGRRAAAASVAGGHVPGSADKAAADRSSRPTGASEGGELRKQQSLLSLAADLVRHFPTLFAEVVVSVARKTDAALWPPLFEAVGSPSSLLEVLVEAGELASAACFLLIIDRLEGAATAQAQALRLMRASLRRGQYPLCCELLRFVVPPDADHETAGEEDSEMGQGTDGRTGGATQGQQQQQQQSQQQQGADQQGGRSWLGWLLGYSAPQPSKQQQEPQPQQPTGAGDPSSSAGDSPITGTPHAASRVQHTLASLGDTSTHRLTAPGAAPSPSRTSGAAPTAPTTTSTALPPDLLLATSAIASAAGPSAAATTTSACKLVAEHAWALLQSGHLAALGQLLHAASFLPGGLAALMSAHRDGEYASGGCAAHTPLDLLSALELAVAELPVWSSEEVEGCAVAVAGLCRAVGAVAWAVALAVMLVDATTVTAFREQEPAAWAHFVSLMHTDENLSYLWDIVQVLSGEGGEEQQLPAGWVGGGGGSAGEAQGQGVSATVGQVEVRALGGERAAVGGRGGSEGGRQQTPTLSEITVASPR